MRRLLPWLTLGMVCLSPCVFGQGPRSHYIVEGITPAVAIRYGQVDCPLDLDLFLPTGEAKSRPKLPVIVFIHGGAWMSGFRQDIPPQMIAYAKQGFAVATIDYRSSRWEKFPANVHDVRAAVRFLRSNAASWGLDPDRIALVGFGSGGHLALVAGLAGPELDGSVGDHDEVPSRVQAVVSFHGPTNMQTILRQDTPGGVGKHRTPVEFLLGGDPAKFANLAKQASPVNHVRAGGPPILLVHGDADDQIPVAQVTEMEAACKKSGAAVECVVFKGHTHRNLRVFDRQRAEPMESFLDKHLEPGSQTPAETP